MSTATLSEYIRRLQALEQAGHGHLPVCFFDGDESPGWVAMSDRDQPYATQGEYQDETSTPHCWKVGPYIVA